MPGFDQQIASAVRFWKINDRKICLQGTTYSGIIGLLVTFVDHATGTARLYNMGALRNMKSELFVMKSTLCDIRSTLCNMGMYYVIWVRYYISCKIIDFHSTIHMLYVVGSIPRFTHLIQTGEQIQLVVRIRCVKPAHSVYNFINNIQHL